MANSADPDQLASSTDLDLHCLQRQGISAISRTRVKKLLTLGLSVPIIWVFTVSIKPYKCYEHLLEMLTML